MNVQLNRNEVSGVIRHFAKKEPARALQVLGDWTREQWQSAETDRARGQADALRAMKLASESLALGQGADPEKTLNGLSTQAFDTARLVAVPAFNGMAGPVVFAFLKDGFRGFQLKDQQLQPVSLREKGDLAADLDNHVTVAISKGKHDLVVSDYREGETMRVTSANRADQKTTFTHMGPNGWVQSKVRDNGMYEALVTDGDARLSVDLAGPGQYRCEMRGL